METKVDQELSEDKEIKEDKLSTLKTGQINGVIVSDSSEDKDNSLNKLVKLNGIDSRIGEKNSETEKIESENGDLESESKEDFEECEPHNKGLAYVERAIKEWTPTASPENLMSDPLKEKLLDCDDTVRPNQKSIVEFCKNQTVSILFYQK